MVVGKTAGLVPLDIANPQGCAGQLRGVVVNLQPQHLVRLHRRSQVDPALGRPEVNGGLLQVQERPQCQVEKIPAAAGRVPAP